MAANEPPAFVPAPERAPPDLKPYRLNGTQDMLELFDLMPLYDRAVRPYLRPEPALPKTFPKELTQLLMKPEYTYAPIVPFDTETLNNAFSVEPSSTPAQGIDVSLLEADEQESPIPKKKKAPNNERPDPRKKRVVLISKKKAQ
ncbi:hypothetical protein MOBT1_003330 [Malassezia obtusa]|uniref:Mediator of RNA polymerase II transcription subunit 19 n=1 Tax=Malassezia obtusa TaxID=76774 RepID=A0AAF0E398_9BASI|nr:hypothetical protein MOBT1_003330 [Malassezia obtusa]